MADKPTPDMELTLRLREAEEILDALRNHKVDAVIGVKQIAMLRLKQVEDERDRFEKKLRKLNATLEKQVADRTKLAEERADKLRQIALQMAHVEEKERQRLANVLHDGLQQLLIGAKFKTRLIKDELSGQEEAFKQIDQLNRILDQSIEASRSLSYELSPPILHDHGLDVALQWLAGEMHQKKGLAVNIHIGGEIPALTQKLKVFLFHAVRELLINIIKHAGVDKSEIHISSEDRDLKIDVIDRGKGFNAADMQLGASTSLGLLSIREKLDLMNGHMSIESEPGRGSRFTLQVPVDQHET